MTKPFNWKIFAILVVAATLGLIAVIPYSLALQGPTAAAQAAARTGMTLPLLITVQIASQVITFALATGIGLSFANSVGLGLPILEAWLRGRRVAQGGLEPPMRTPAPRGAGAIFPISVILGVIGALVIIAIEVLVFQPLLKAQLGSGAAVLTSPNAKPAAWKGFLASFYGGFDEEILLRLCVMSFLVWLGRLVSKTADGHPTTAVFWVANVVAAVLFGLGHLPATSAILPLTPLVVVRAVVLNGLLGVAFGWLYVKHGLESAMISHFSADLVLHVLFAI
jgi:hypothetical protein